MAFKPLCVAVGLFNGLWQALLSGVDFPKDVLPTAPKGKR